MECSRLDLRGIDWVVEGVLEFESTDTYSELQARVELLIPILDVANKDVP